jgi:hypothetical protein
MLPTINTYSVSDDKFGLYWKATPKSNIKGWNLYGSYEAQVDFIPPEKGLVLPNGFTKLRDNLPNHPNSMTPGSVYVEVTRSELGLSGEAPYYFTITANEEVSPGTIVESSMEVPNVHAVPRNDAYFVDEAGWPCNVVYKNFEFDLWPLSGWDVDRYLDIVSLLGRPAREAKIDSVGANIWVKFNSLTSDPISIRHSDDGFDLKRGELMIHKIYVHNPTVNDATVRIFVAA